MEQRMELSTGAALACEQSGDGDDLVLVHGIAERMEAWDPVRARTDGMRVTSVDLRGHGRSARIPPFDVPTMIEDLVEAMAALRIDRPVLVGHSLGGLVVTGAAAETGARAVINVDQPLALGGFQELLRPLEPSLRSEEFDATLAGIFDALTGPALAPGEVDRLRALRRPDREVVLSIWAPVLGSSVAELDALVDAVASGVRVPYLSLHGADPGPEYAGWLGERIPTAQVEVWDGHGHYPHLVDPDRFVARLRAFIRDAPAA